MARHAITRQKLRCRDGHWEFADFELVPLGTGVGFGMRTRCDFGDHWLMAAHPPHSTRVAVGMTPYAWPSAGEAFAARDRWEQQEAAQHPPEDTTETTA